MHRSQGRITGQSMPIPAALTSTLSPPRIGSGHCEEGHASGSQASSKAAGGAKGCFPTATCLPASSAARPMTARPCKHGCCSLQQDAAAHAPHTRGAGCSRSSCPRPGRWRSRRRTTRGTQRGSCCGDGKAPRSQVGGRSRVGRAAGRPVLAAFAACWPQTSAGCCWLLAQPISIASPHPCSFQEPNVHILATPAAHLVMGFCSTLVLERISLNTAPCGGNQQAEMSMSGAQPLIPAGRKAGWEHVRHASCTTPRSGGRSKAAQAAGRAVQQAGPQQLRWRWEPPPTMLAV